MPDIIYLPPPGQVVNAPSEEGRDVGRILAERIGCPTHEMCDDCVFRHGSWPNGCEATLDDAMKCLLDPKTEGAFYCAHRDSGEHPVCAGYAHAMKLMPLSPRPK